MRADGLQGWAICGCQTEVFWSPRSEKPVPTNMSIHWIRHSAGNQGDSLPAVSLGVGRTAKQISAGKEHACVILDDDSAKCWGYNKNGQLGAV